MKLSLLPAVLALGLAAVAGLAVTGCGRTSGDAGAADTSFFACRDCNVVMVSVDTLRADRLGAYGYDRPTSPHLDALARESVVFRDVLAQAPSTASSHRSLFMGRYVSEHRNGEIEWPTLAGVLREHGWRTAAFVDGGKLTRAFGLDRGFEVYEESGRPENIAAGPTGGLPVLAPKALAWLRDHRGERSFLFLHTYEVHCPYVPPEPWKSQFTDGFEARFSTAGLCGNDFKRLRLDDRERRYVSDLYDAEIRTVDEQLGDFFEQLRQLGLLDRTVVVVLSDHGESLGERRKIGHNEVFDVQLKVPLIVRVPSHRHAEVAAPVQLVDVMPTLLHALGVPYDFELSGRDLAPYVAGTEPAERLRLAETGKLNARSVRLDRRWSLVTRQAGPFGLYDLASDPAEESNLLGQHPGRAKALQAALDELGFGWRGSREEPKHLSAEDEAKLRALGYVGD